MLSSGLASSIAIADESTPVDETTKAAVQVDENIEVQAEQADDGKIEVRISMPDGRTIIRYESPRRSSARRSFPSSSAASGSRILADGSRLSMGHSSAFKGSSSSSSARLGSSHSSGSRSASGGGGVGGASSSSSSGSSGGGSAKVSAQSMASGGSGSSGSASASSSSSSSGSSGSSTGSSSNSSTGSSASPPRAHRTVHTVGGARHSAEEAVGGQRVEFHDGDMGASVIGNTVYFNNVQLVKANQAFDILTGTRIGADSAIMQEGRLAPSGSGSLSSWDTGSSAIKLDFESNTVVELVMFSEPENSTTPDRIQRTWTVRIR